MITDAQSFRWYQRTVACRGLLLLTLLTALVSVRGAEPAPAAPKVHPKVVFAHYMGCWPVASGALQYEKGELPRTFKPSSGDKVTKLGGHVRNYDLEPPGMVLTAEQSADLEIRRAMRIGIDGFAVDAWAGGNDARRTLDALFKVAEEKDYPFQLTVCIDPCTGGDPVGTVKEVLAKHGNSPKLARRDGKPLIFGYMSTCYGIAALTATTDPQLSEEARKAQQQDLRLTKEGWELMGQAYDKYAQEVGQPIAYHYCLTYFFLGIDQSRVQKGMLTTAAGIIGKHVQAVGAFMYFSEYNDVCPTVKASGAEWSAYVGMYQKENIPYECWPASGTECLGSWEGAIATDATLLQLITWNDYGENSNIAPALNTRYDLYDLTGYYISYWKTGKRPEPDHDKVYLTYHKYPKGARIWPFKSCFGPHDYPLDVTTILTKPATIRLPGRKLEYEAPAGFFRKQFPLAVGEVSADLVRDGKVEIHLVSPEPVTDRPFREDNGLVCFSTEDARYWKADFGDTPISWYSEYGDADGNGLPNWYEMLYFGKWLDLSTAVGTDPKACPQGDGKSNLEKYLQRIDPTLPIPATSPDGLDTKPANALEELDGKK